jgi:CheY-like chemotaxis protein/HPt (histidine-containing phosphotransfer) domain-containing protein
VEQGLIYCGGRERYIDILKTHAFKGSENWDTLEELYAAEDWENYVITVHAVKSSMLSIGAGPLSEMAKSLEEEGKAGHYDYIRENHAPMIREYKRVIEEISTCLSAEMSLNKQEEQPETDDGVQGQQELSELSETDFDEYAARMEDAAYDLDQERMLTLLNDLERCSYYGIPMKKSLASVRRKVEKEDLMSASSKLLQVRGKIKEKAKRAQFAILLVEDNEINALLVKDLLEENGRNVDIATNGEECLALTQKKYYHLILMDYLMPGGNGAQTLQTLRAQENNPCRSTPALLLTATGTAEARAIADQYGFDGCLEKPIRAEVLESEIIRLSHLKKES